MSETLKPGVTATVRVNTSRDRPMGVTGEKGGLYSTPQLLYDMEVACRHLLLLHIEPGKDSVGTRIELDQLGATLLGMSVDITVTVTAVNGAAVSFDFVVPDDVEEIAHGKHTASSLTSRRPSSGSGPSSRRSAAECCNSTA
jgi:predicted thioesterase